VELGSAFKNNDRVETMDGVADLLYVLYGACYTYDLNPDLMLDSIYGDYNTFYNKIKLEVFNSSTSPEEYYKKLLDDINNVKSNLLDGFNLIKLYSVLIKTIISTFEFGFSLRIDINKIFDIVHNSNMSKLCSNEEEAKETVEYYKNKYDNYINNYEELCNKYGKESEQAKSAYSPYDSPYYYKSGNYWLVKNESTGKALKSINYTPVIL
jgi:predicted HAD superfamily Cof-like phosphohydrolase